MNKIFKVVWSRVKQCYVVTSEMAKSTGRSKSSVAVPTVAAMMCVVALTAAGGNVLAEDNMYFHVNTKDVWPGSGTTITAGNDGTGNATTNLGTSSTAAGATGAKSIAAGENAQAAGAWSIAMGTNATVRGESHQTNGIAIGADSYVMADKAANYRSSVAIGAKASVRGGTVTVTDPASGKSREASFGRGSVAIGTNALANRIVTNGTISDSDALYNTNSGALTGTSSDKNASIMWLAGMENDQLDNNEATAIGFDARAVGDQSIAIGAQVVAGHASVAIGGNDMESVVDPRTNAPAGKAKDNAATYERIVGEAIADNRILVNGKDFWPTTSAKEGSVAIGQKAFSRTLMGTTIGTSAAVNEGGTLGTAIGAGARVGASDGTVLTEGGVAIAAGAVAEQNHTTAIGTGTQVLAVDATAIGYKNKVTGERSVALGNELNVTTADSVVLGSGSKGDDTASTVTSGTIRGTDYDTDSTDTFTYSGFAGRVDSTGHYVSVGAPNRERQIKNVAPGEISSTSTDAINGSQLYVVTNALHNRGLNFTADNTTASDTNTTVHRDLGETLKIEGDTNIITTADHSNGKISVGLNKDVTLGKVTDPTTPGEDGSLTVTGTAGNTVAINGGDGSINMAGPNNSNAISIKPSEGPATLDGTPDANGNTPNISRITYDRMEPVLDADGNPVLDADGNPQMQPVTETVATMNDGLRFTGNNESTENKHKLNTLVKIQGEGTQEVTKPDGTKEIQTSTGKTFVSAKDNIVVEADGTDTLTVKLNKDLQHINTISNGGSTLTLNATPGTDAAGNTTPAVQISGGDLDMGGNKISNLKPGTAPTDAATVGQLTTVRSDNKSITVTDDNVDTDGNIIDPTKGHVYNIEVNNQSVVENAQTPVVYTDAAGNKVYKQADGTFNTAIDGTGTVVQPGNVIASMNDGSNSTTAPMIFNNVGSAIEGKDGDTFLDQLNNAAKPVNEGGTPNAAVNVSDLKHTADGLTAKGLNFTGNNESTTNHRDLGQTLKIQGEGTQEVTKADGTTEMQTSTGKTFVSAKDNIVVEADGTDTLTVKLNKDLQHINTITNGGSSITLNDNPGSIDANGNPVPAVKISGGDLDMGGNKISNLKPGTAPTDAATVGQLTTVTSPNKTISVVDTNLNADGTFKDSSKGHTYEIEVNSQSVVNNAQTPVVYTDAAGNKVYKQADGTFNTAVDGTGTVVQPGNVIASMNDGSNSTTAPMILNNVGSAIEGKDGDTFLDKLDNAADGTIGTPNAAVNVSDLKHTADGLTVKGLNFTADNTIASDTNTTVHRDLGKTLKIEGDGNIKTTADNKNAKISVGLNKDVTLGKVTDPTTPGEDGSLTVTGTAGNTVAINGGEGSINMAGPNNSNAISIKPSEGPTTLDGTPNANGTTPNISRITYDRTEPVLDANGNPVLDADGNPQTKTVTETVATMNDGLRFTGNNTDTVNNHKLNTLVKVQGEGVDTVASANFQSAAGNINVKANGTDTLEVQLSKNLQGINTITNGGSSITLNENPGAYTPAVSINGGNLSMGGNKITNVVPGTEKTDAATVGQLPQVTSSNDSVRVIESVNEDGAKVYDLAVDTVSPAVVNELADEIGRVGAQGAALAALKPIQYDPLEPTQIMAGYGNYRGNSALALGVAHYKNESTMIHGGVSWAAGDGNHMMANAGITWKVGSRDSEAAIADRYRKGPISSAYALQNEMAAMKAENTGLKGEVAGLKAQNDQIIAENAEMKAENQEMKAQIAMLMQRLGL